MPTVGCADAGSASFSPDVMRFLRQHILRAGALFSWLCGGLGFIWMLFDKDKRCWHDRLSATKIINL